MKHLSAEHTRLLEYQKRLSNWKHWGPYLSDRSWGTVREDYSVDGEAWRYFPHEHARSRTYRWGEDGIFGISDRNQFLCFALSFWNENDPILKERLFGLAGDEGNHGEDVKEYYFYIDSTPTHSYMKALYKYPIQSFPYENLVAENKKRSREAPEYELVDTGILDEQRYFDCQVEYAKAGEDDLFIVVEIFNRYTQPARLHTLPTLWFRNTWSWGYPHGPMKDAPGYPTLEELRDREGDTTIKAQHHTLGTYYLYAQGDQKTLFTNNETNRERILGKPSRTPYTKDAFHRHLIKNQSDAVNPENQGTKAAVHYTETIPAGGSIRYVLRLSKKEHDAPFSDVDTVLNARKNEADEFYNVLHCKTLNEEERRVQRQAYAGLLWTKQLYYYDVEQWIKGDPSNPESAQQREKDRNTDWLHLTNFDIISMPDKWEFPWYAAWDLAFHCIPFAQLDPDFAKRQLELMTREWYMHPNGQLPAYEWAFGDVNPPVHSMATWRVYKIDAALTGKKDRQFLEKIFHKLLLNFTWWVNRKDSEGHNIFQGGFLGLDNIGIFDRSAPLPAGGRIDQADGTSWMAAYCLSMLKIALELAQENPVYQDSAAKFLEHFLRVAHAMTNIGDTGSALWSEEDGFFYDVMHFEDGSSTPLRVRSLVGLLPIIAVDTLEPDVLERLPDFARRLKWFVRNRPHLAGNMARIDAPGVGHRRLIALLTRERLVKVLRYMFDENEFLSEYGIRSLSKFHKHSPFTMHLNGKEYAIGYEPAESKSFLFGGNSNWRGPIWFPMNFIIIEALREHHDYYGDELKVEYPTYSGTYLTLSEIADDLSKRLCSIFLKQDNASTAFYGDNELFRKDKHFKDLILFNEYFNGDTGMGLGASHQCGWTSLVAKLLQRSESDF